MSTHSKNPTKHAGLVKSGHHHHHLNKMQLVLIFSPLYRLLTHTTSKYIFISTRLTLLDVIGNSKITLLSKFKSLKNIFSIFFRYSTALFFFLKRIKGFKQFKIFLQYIYQRLS
jgi:hypothetical protein